MSTYNIIEKYIKDALSSKSSVYSHLAGNGAVASLEAKLCSLYGARHALNLNAATNGILYLLLAAELQKKDIITTPLSWGGTISGAYFLGCKLNFADIDTKTLNICPQSVNDCLYKNNRIKAVIAVDFAGNPHDIISTHKICEKFGVWHFVDAAQSMGAIYDGFSPIQFCDAMVVSFGSGKAIFGGEGGAIITDNTELYIKLLSICQHPHRQERDCGIGMSTELALNGRIHPIAAIMVDEGFEAGLKLMNDRRKKMCVANQMLQNLDAVSSVVNHPNGTFYHSLFFTDNESMLKREFDESTLVNDFSWSKSAFVPLPEQLRRIGKSSLVNTYNNFKLENTLSKLYVLNFK